jgi:hypothetical protein
MLSRIHMESTFFQLLDLTIGQFVSSLDTLSKPLKKPFRFEKFWLLHPDFLNNIKIGGKRCEQAMVL